MIRSVAITAALAVSATPSLATEWVNCAGVAELRLFKASEGDAATVYAGTLRIPGHGAWVSCSGT